MTFIVNTEIVIIYSRSFKELDDKKPPKLSIFPPKNPKMSFPVINWKPT